MSCKLSRLGKYGIVEKYTCDQVRDLFAKWDEDFIQENRVDVNRQDRYYLNWKKQIEDFLMNCDCDNKKEKDFDWEDKSDPDWFKKRLDLAKEARKNSESPWKKLLEENS